MASPQYRGYSSVSSQGVHTNLYDEDLVVQDLINHFHTRSDERIGRPRYGSIIWDLLFDLFDPRTEGLVISDAERILASDPRVKKLSITADVQPDLGSITLNVKVKIIEFDIDRWFTVTFSEQQ